MNSDVKVSDGLRSLEKLSYEDKAVSSNLTFIKTNPHCTSFFCFTSRNNNSKGSKTSEFSISLGFTENLGFCRIRSFQRHVIHMKKNKISPYQDHGSH